MLGVGVGYIIMGLVPIFVKKLNGQLTKHTVVIHNGFLYCGIAILLLYGVGFLLSLNMAYRTALAALPILVVTPVFLVYIKKQILNPENTETRKDGCT